jgi:colanic acid/amylovoran biosynthesis protein
MSPRAKKVILLGAGFTTQNMGVWALASGAVTSVLNSYPDAQISFLDYGREPACYEINRPGGTVVVQLVNLRFSKKIWQPNHIARLLLTALLLRAIPSRSFRNRLISRDFWLRHIETADLVGSIAGGDSFGDIYGLGRLIYVALPQLLVLLLKKPLVLLPQTIGPFKGRLAKAVARYILCRAHTVYSRDYQSVEVLRALGCCDNVRPQFCYDMGFVVEARIRKERIPLSLTRLDPATSLVGLNVSGLLYIGGYTRKNMFGLGSDYRALVHGLIESLVQTQNAHILLLPHVFGGGGNEESDVTACDDVLRDAERRFKGHLHRTEGRYDQHELKALIGRCDFFLGSRMHACIAALSQCVPAMGLAYSDKFLGVFKSIGMEDLVIDLRGRDQDFVIELVDQAYRRRAEVRAQLELRMPSVQAAVLGLLTKIL